MNTVRGLLFDHLGLKLVALLLAVLVYLNVYTDRPAVMPIMFRLQVTGLADSLTLTGSAPAAVQAQLRGTGKQLLLLRVTEPAVKLSLAGVGVGRFTRALTPADLPLAAGVELLSESSVSPSQIELQVDHKRSRELPVAARIEGTPAAGMHWDGAWAARPATIVVHGPAGSLASLDSVVLSAVPLTGKHDTLHLHVVPVLPDWCTSDPPTVELTVPIAGARR